MRTEIETFEGAGCVGWAWAPLFCWLPAPVETEIVCETSPLSPGLPMRTDTEMFVAPPCAAAVAASATDAGSGTLTPAIVDVSDVSGESARAGCAKPSTAAAITATPTPATRPRDLVKKMAVPPLSTSIQ